MSAQRYSSPAARERMDCGLCPECGEAAGNHSQDQRFWLPRTCDLTPAGVTDRILQFRVDRDGGES